MKSKDLSLWSGVFHFALMVFVNPGALSFTCYLLYNEFRKGVLDYESCLNRGNARLW